MVEEEREFEVTTVFEKLCLLLASWQRCRAQWQTTSDLCTNRRGAMALISQCRAAARMARTRAQVGWFQLEIVTEEGVGGRCAVL